MLSLASTVSGGAGYEDSCLAYSASLPEVFGPPLWWVIHTTAATYPKAPDPQRQEECVSFVQALPGMVPCSACGAHLRSELAQHDIAAACASSKALSHMWCRVHNAVNARLGKPLMDCNLVQEEYETVPICNPLDAFAAGTPHVVVPS